jgi:hypothetical protein
MYAYMDAYVDDDVDITAHLLTAQHQRQPFLAYFSPFSI